MSHDLLESIKSFVAVTENGSFSAAARSLDISAPVLTKQVRWLEEVLQHRLLNRTTRQVELTEAGATYLLHAKKILEDINLAKNAVLNLEHEPHGNITIGISTDLSDKFFAKKFQSFLERYPKITLKHIAKNDASALLTKEADIIITWENISHSQLIKNKLFSPKLGIFASPDYLKKNGVPTTMQSLLDHNCLINSRHPEWEFDHKHIQMHGRYFSESSLNLYYTGLSGLGLFQTLTILVADDIKNKKLVELRLDLKPAVKVVYLYHLPVHGDSIVRLIADYLQRCIPTLE
jgi:DNA-binding transcriptional LysR family regulator